MVSLFGLNMRIVVNNFTIDTNHAQNLLPYNLNRIYLMIIAGKANLSTLLIVFNTLDESLLNKRPSNFIPLDGSDFIELNQGAINPIGCAYYSLTNNFEQILRSDCQLTILEGFAN